MIIVSHVNLDQQEPGGDEPNLQGISCLDRVFWIVFCSLEFVEDEFLLFLSGKSTTWGIYRKYVFVFWRLP